MLKFNERDRSDVLGLAWSASDRLITISQGLKVARV
jgi:hypothetical protein